MAEKFLIYKDEFGRNVGYQSFLSLRNLEQEIIDQLVDELPDDLKDTPGYNIRMTRDEVIADEMKQAGYNTDKEIAIIKDTINSLLQKTALPQEYVDMEAKRQQIKDEVDIKYNGEFRT